MSVFEVVLDVHLAILLSAEKENLTPSRLARLVMMADSSAKKFCKERGAP